MLVQSYFSQVAVMQIIFGYTNKIKRCFSMRSAAMRQGL